MSLLMVGSIAYDSVKTPFGMAVNVLGGSASYSSVASSFFSDVNLIGIVGSDFQKSDVLFFNERNINIDGLEFCNGKTFAWEGEYTESLSEAFTINTQLNVFNDFNPVLNDKNKNVDYVFLANIDPEIQLNILNQLTKPKLVALDTMNLWISIKKEKLIEVISKVDILFINESEIKQLTGEKNIIKAKNIVFGYGCLKYLVVKKGENGVLLFDQNSVFALPSYPVDCVIDPTGAGDSFAGGFMGYLSKVDKINSMALRQASVVGTVMASINIEDFSLNRFKNIDSSSIFTRLSDFRLILDVDEVLL